MKLIRIAIAVLFMITIGFLTGVFSFDQSGPERVPYLIIQTNDGVELLKVEIDGEVVFEAKESK